MKGTSVITIAAFMTVFVQQAQAWAKSSIVASDVKSGEGITAAGKQLNPHAVLMFPVSTSKSHDQIVIYFNDGKCHDSPFGYPVTISQQFGKGGWYGWQVQDGGNPKGDIVMGNGGVSTFTLKGDSQGFVILDYTGTRAIQTGGTLVKSSLKVGDLSKASTFKLLNAPSCQHSFQGLIVQ